MGKIEKIKGCKGQLNKGYNERFEQIVLRFFYTNTTERQVHLIFNCLIVCVLGNPPDWWEQTREELTQQISGKPPTFIHCGENIAAIEQRINNNKFGSTRVITEAKKAWG